MFNLRYLEVFCWMFVITALLQLIGDEYALGFILTLIFINIFLFIRQTVKISYYSKIYSYIFQYKKLARYSLELFWSVTLLEIYYFYCITRKCNHYLYHTGAIIEKLLVKQINKYCWLLASIIENFKSGIATLMNIVQNHIKSSWIELLQDYNISEEKSGNLIKNFEKIETVLSEQDLLSFPLSEDFTIEAFEKKIDVEEDMLNYLEGNLALTVSEVEILENKIINYLGSELSKEFNIEVANKVDDVEEEAEINNNKYNPIFEDLNSWNTILNINKINTYYVS